nr:TonB-dependent receptor [uncultured Sphingomonas sp.]
MRQPTFLALLLASAAALPVHAQSLDDSVDEGEEIVVTGQKPRGSVIGDIPAENVLSPRDIRATGATSIQELLDAVAPQTGSARGRGGGRPIILINGQRTSGWREMRDLPPEAIERMEILPEEVALKYGYSADQRVVNFVLRRRFNSTTVDLAGKAATEGDYVAADADATRLIIANGKRTSLNLHLEGNTPLYENDRDILLQPVGDQPIIVDPRPYRTLTGAATDMRLTGTANRSLGDATSGTFTAELERTTGKSRLGVPTGTLDPTGTTDADFTTITRAFPGSDPLTRNSESNAIRLGAALNGTLGKWRWSSTGNAEFARSTTRSDRGYDLTSIQDRIDAGDPAVDLFTDMGGVVRFADDRSKSVRKSIDLDTTLNGRLFALPAGDANATVKVGASAMGVDSEAFRTDVRTSSDPTRRVGEASVSLDMPVTKRASSIGRLTANLNAGAKHLSDFGTLTSLGAGLNWTPAPRLNLITSWTREEGAPTLQQLGDPIISTSGVRFFDFTRNETVIVTTKTGGNPDLNADRRNVFKIGGNWQPKQELDLRLRAEFVRERIDNPQGSFPAASATLQQAFGDRFIRDADGNLISVDLRPVNYDQSKRSTIRLGFDFSKPLASKPPTEQQIAAFREQFRRQAGRDGGASAGPGRPSPAPPAEGAPPSGSQAAQANNGRQQTAPGPGGRGFGGGRFGGRNGGRLTFSLTDTITVKDEVRIGPGLPKLDYLNGDAVGGLGGRPRHQIEAQGGYFNNGIGARLSANWRSGTTVKGAAGDLDFSPYATFDLRLFANLGERFDLVSKHPFLRGSSVRFEVTNIFNAKPKVRDGAGNTPVNYQPDLIEPIGRMIGISFRKLFVPRQFFRQGGAGGSRGGNSSPPPSDAPPSDAPPASGGGAAGPPQPTPGG